MSAQSKTTAAQLAGLVLALTLRSASAETAVNTTVTYPAIASVDTVVNASIAITNISTAPDDRRDVVVNVLYHTPSCGSYVDAECPIAVRGVFRVDNAVGRSGTACAGAHFTAGPPHPFSGAFQLSPDQPFVLGPVHGHGSPQCVIDFAVAVLSVPAIDSNLQTPGLQTVALASALIADSIAPTHPDGMFSGFSEMTVIESACASAPSASFVAAPPGCTILQSGSGNPGDDKIVFSGHGGTIKGDVCVGPGSTLKAAGAGFVTGHVVIDRDASAQVTASCSSSIPGVDCSRATVRDLGDEISACAALAATAAARKCTIGDYGKTLLAIAGPSRTIVGSPGENVVCVKDVNLDKDQVVTLTGAATTTFIINVNNKFSINGGKIVVDGTYVQAADVLYNVIGKGDQVDLKGNAGQPCCSGQIDGNLIAGDRNVSLNAARINGNVCGDGAIAFDGGASVCAAVRP